MKVQWAVFQVLYGQLNKCSLMIAAKHQCEGGIGVSCRGYNYGEEYGDWISESVTD